jgi:hypothetical protein
MSLEYTMADVLKLEEILRTTPSDQHKYILKDMFKATEMLDAYNKQSIKKMLEEIRNGGE